MKEYSLMNPDVGITLFYPHIPTKAADYVAQTLATRWIGQGPKVDEFEEKFSAQVLQSGRSVAVNSGTSALHLAYILSGVKKNSEVLCPVFTCTATNIPILYQNAKPVFLDIADRSFNIDLSTIESKITSKTAAITVVDYGGLPNDYLFLRQLCDKHSLKLIVDCAHSVDTRFDGKHVSSYADYVIYSFQAIKTITTGDGGMLIVKSNEDYEKARRIRWFGIDRTQKQKGIWDNDISEIGYKYQMTDIAASIGLAALEELETIKSTRRQIYKTYMTELEEFSDNLMEAPTKRTDFTPWLVTLNTRGRRIGLMDCLRENNIESAQVHYRNDIYSLFSKYVNGPYPNMDRIEDDYLVLPAHTKVSIQDVEKICGVVKSYLRTD